MNKPRLPFRIQHETPLSSITRVIEESLIEYHATIAQALPATKWHADDSIFWMSSGVPFDFYNGVFRSTFEDPGVDIAIERIKAEFEALQLPFVWQLGPSSKPANLDSLLLEHGLNHDETEPGMAIDLMTMNEDLPTASNIEINTVRTETEMDHWIETWAFGAPKSFLQICKSIHGRLSLCEDSPWRYFIGIIGGQPVATALLFLGEQAAVVHWIATLPQVRRRGIGAAITLAVLKEACNSGYHTAVLTASDESVTIYKRIGFREYCKISKYQG